MQWDRLQCSYKRIHRNSWEIKILLMFGWRAPAMVSIIFILARRKNLREILKRRAILNSFFQELLGSFLFFQNDIPRSKITLFTIADYENFIQIDDFKLAKEKDFIPLRLKWGRYLCWISLPRIGCFFSTRNFWEIIMALWLHFKKFKYVTNVKWRRVEILIAILRSTTFYPPDTLLHFFFGRDERKKWERDKWRKISTFIFFRELSHKFYYERKKSCVAINLKNFSGNCDRDKTLRSVKNY